MGCYHQCPFLSPIRPHHTTLVTHCPQRLDDPNIFLCRRHHHHRHRHLAFICNSSERRGREWLHSSAQTAQLVQSQSLCLFSLSLFPSFPFIDNSAINTHTVGPSFSVPERERARNSNVITSLESIGFVLFCFFSSSPVRLLLLFPFITLYEIG